MALNLVLKKNYFVFNYKIYHQKTRVAMGFPISPTLAPIKPCSQLGGSLPRALPLPPGCLPDPVMQRKDQDFSRLLEWRQWPWWCPRLDREEELLLQLELDLEALLQCFCFVLLDHFDRERWVCEALEWREDELLVTAVVAVRRPRGPGRPGAAVVIALRQPVGMSMT